MALVALSDLRAELKLATADTSDDAYITTLASEVSTWIDTYIDRVLASASYTHDLEMDGSDILRPREWPVTTVSSIKVGSGFYWSSVTAEDSNTYAITSDARGIRRYGKWTCGNIARVAYTAGYSTFPADLVGVARRIGAARYRQMADRRHGETSRTTSDQTTASYGDLVTNDDRAILDRYRRWGA